MGTALHSKFIGQNDLHYFPHYCHYRLTAAGKNLRSEPKHIVFFTKLLLLLGH